MTLRTLAELHATPGRVLGTWTQFTDPQAIDLLGEAGFDFAIVDGEHGALGIETAGALVRACEAAGMVPLLRVPRGDASWIAKGLDAGAAGIVAPGVESADEARALVAATQFAPHGTRGACPIVRVAGHSLKPWHEVVAQQADAGLIALVESAAGVAACEAIAAVDGVAALMVGPFDLSVSLGHGGRLDVDEVCAATEKVVMAARAAGVPAWMPVFAPDPAEVSAQVAWWAAFGVRHFAVGADKIMFARAVAGYRALSASA